jgi:hypothetical protein
MRPGFAGDAAQTPRTASINGPKIVNPACVLTNIKKYNITNIWFLGDAEGRGNGLVR